MAWQPDQQGLRELTYLLREAANPNGRDQGLISQRLQLFNEYPDYNAYLIYILTKATNEDINTRRVAGLQLKNNIKNNFNSIPMFTLNYVKQTCIEALAHPEVVIVKTLSSVVSSIVSRGQVHNWLDVLSFLIHQLNSNNKLAIEAALNTLVMICEDTAIELDEEMHGIRPLSFMLPKFIEFISSAEPRWRVQAINATSQFVLLKSPSFVEQFDAILTALYARTSDSDHRVRRELGRILAILWEAFPDRLQPYLYPTIEYMIQATMDQDEEVALGACDFWVQYAQVDRYHDELVPYLTRLVNCLLRLMVYSEKDLLDLSDEPMHTPFIEEDSDQAIRPRYYRPKNPIESPEPVDHPQNYSDSESEFDSDEHHITDDDEHDDDRDEFDDFDDDEFYSQVSLRQSSAAALDVLSVTYKSDIASVLLDQLLHHTLHDSNWLIRESGILALGAAAEGGIEVISRYLHQLIPYLLNSMQDSQPLIRSISCWATSRFSKWLMHQYDTNEQGRQLYFESVLYALLHTLLDTNKRVQESACTAFTILEENASNRLRPYIYSILTHTNKAFTLYRRKNRLILYDALGTLADSVGHALNNPTYIGLLMPPLITKWNELADNDTDLFPLLECLSNITAALGSGFKPFVEPVLSRCVQLISSTLQQQAYADEYPDKISPPNVEFLIAALDLLSGIVQGLGSNIQPLIANTNPPLLSLLRTCIHDPVSEVLQSTFALIGDIAIACFNLLEPFIPDIMVKLIQVLKSPEYIISVVSVYNNALWAIGEIVMRWKSKTMYYIPALIDVLVPLLKHAHAPPSVHENSMVALGRLGLACPENVAPHLRKFIKPWLKKSLSVREGDEKDSAFRGLCAMIRINVKDAQEELYLLLVSISTWKSPSSLLSKDLHDVVEGFYQMTSQDEWNYTFSSLNKEEQAYIQSILGKNHT
ncbi:hypothetical protein RMATCC62417_06342 [Rhizopus microsporus]|nr:hypothetical protein RMATCC62417_06342 [Rhizopus microsporus]